MTQRIITANRLIDGAVVYLAADGGWTTTMADGRVAEDDAAATLMAVAERAVAGRLVVAPYLIDVVAEDGTVRPVRYREVIRATGPSVAFGPSGT
jgi:hypothetical protein